MSDPLPDALVDAISRISSPEGDVPASPGVTGQLEELRAWWWRRASDSVLTVQEVLVPGDGSAEDALRWGITAADRAIDAGATLLVPRAGAREGQVARAIIGLLTRREASAILAQPEGMSDRAWMDEVTQIRDLMATHRELTGDHLPLMSAMGAGVIAGIAGVLIGAAARATPCLIDGTEEWAGALVADRLAHRARHWWRSASSSSDPARTAARERIDIEPGVPLDLSDDRGLGAQSTTALLRVALDA